MASAESRRLREDEARGKNWKRWGPYLSERQWGTVREDYSAGGEVWSHFPHDHARSRAYRWGEDGLLGITDRKCRLCFAVALWNERDPILKERLFGLTGPEGNHGEDVKEVYHYLDSTPTHSYMKALYRYPQAEYPYAQLVQGNAARGKREPELELVDTGVFAEDRFFDVVAEYAKADADDILIRITVTNRGPEARRLHLLPTLWFRNTWTWGCRHEGCEVRPSIAADGDLRVVTRHATLPPFVYQVDPECGPAALLFTENETNTERLYGHPNAVDAVKDAFHEAVVHGRAAAVSAREEGTKVATHHVLEIDAGGSATVRCRLSATDAAPEAAFGHGFETLFDERRAEADAFYAENTGAAGTGEAAALVRQAYAGLLWTKQFYHFVVRDWLDGDPEMPPAPPARRHGRNHDWHHVYCNDVISMPDKWEYPWFAAWDLAFHMIPLARIDPAFAKSQLLLFLREWYMHPNGAIPAYEFAFSDVNPPVHAWACWRVYKITAQRGERDRVFLARAFQKLMLNFTWWVNRKDDEGNHIFAGGFLGLDNIGVFDRSKPLPTGGKLDQADGTAWMAFYCGTLLSMALELARDDPSYEDIAFKFFRHFVAIVDAINGLDGTGLWEEEDGFYYDHLRIDDRTQPVRIRSLVGLVPLIAAEILEEDLIAALPDFSKRISWFHEHRKDLARHITYLEAGDGAHRHRLLAIPSRERLERVLRYLLDEEEFLSPYGIRSLSRHHEANPFVFTDDGRDYEVRYTPGESDTYLFGGNSNWRGPIWFPVNFLIVEALERYHHFYGEDLKVECPTGSGTWMNLREVADEIMRRHVRLFLPDADGRRAYRCDNDVAAEIDGTHPYLFYEYFHGDTGRGLGASHQTGWTALVARFLEKLA